MIAAIVLAAGKSTRMGRTKALLPIGGATFLSHIIETFRDAGVERIAVVVGHDAERVRAAHESCGVDFAVNARYEDGQLSSLLVGLEALRGGEVEAALWTPVDVPFVTVQTVRAVIDRFRATRVPIVRPVRGARHGHPVLVAASLFDQLRALSPAVGAKPVVRSHASAAGDVEVDDEGAFFDIDTPAEYARATTLMTPRR